MVPHRRKNLLMRAVVLLLLGGLSPSVAWGQKDINFSTIGTVRSTLLFGNYTVPDVYSFFAQAGEFIRVETSNSAFDTTIRVVGPDASFDLFDDDSGSGSNSRLRFTAPDTGVYIVIVSSFDGNPGGGVYDITLARGSLALEDATPKPGLGKSMLEVENPVELKPQP